MSNPCKYHSWYHHNFMTDFFVVESDYETIGVYILLLHRQMVEGSIPSNIDRLIGQVGHRITKEKFLEIWEERNLKYQFKPVKREWESHRAAEGGACDPKIHGVWKDLPEPLLDRDGSPRLFNEHLHQVMKMDERIFRSRGKGGSTAQSNRATASKESSEVMEAMGATPTFDFKPILQIMPKRVKDGKKGWDGWDEGRDLLKFITTQEEYDDLYAATQVYARQQRGEKAGFHFSLKTWVKGEYLKYVPEKQKQVLQLVASQGAAQPVVEVVEEVFASTNDKIKALLKRGRTISDPPWQRKSFDTDEAAADRDAKWSEEARVKWLNKYLENPNA